MRSISVEGNNQTQTQKYHIPRPPTNTSGINSNQISQINEKKIAVPKLNLQVLPNYHGKSNKSLNQSLM